MISETNKQKRMQFAKMCLDNHDNFDNVIWTDESSVQLKRHCQTMRVKMGNEVTFKPVTKHALKVYVWAGISKRGATNICVFDHTMDAPLYVSILKDFLLPFIQEHFERTNYRFMQDNNPKHTSQLAKASMSLNELTLTPCSTCLPSSKAFLRSSTCCAGPGTRKIPSMSIPWSEIASTQLRTIVGISHCITWAWEKGKRDRYSSLCHSVYCSSKPRAHKF